MGIKPEIANIPIEEYDNLIRLNKDFVNSLKRVLAEEGSEYQDLFKNLTSTLPPRYALRRLSGHTGKLIDDIKEVVSSLEFDHTSLESEKEFQRR